MLIELVLSCCYGTEIFGFCALMMSFLSSVAVATVREKDEISVQNVEIEGKRTAQDELINTTIMKKIKSTLIALVMSLGLSGFLSAQDWPNLKQFQEDNTKVGLPEKGENRVVFMGNSITIGWLNSRPEFFEGKPYINRGIGGQTTPQMLIRFRQDVLALQPKVVVILAGTNDIAGNTGKSTIEMIADNIKSMAELAHANDIKVVLSSTLPAYDYPWRPGLEPAEKIVALNEMLKTYCEEKGHIYLDYFSAMVDDRKGLPKKYAADEVHPTVEGYKVMEPLVEEAITKALGKE